MHRSASPFRCFSFGVAVALSCSPAAGARAEEAEAPVLAMSAELTSDVATVVSGGFDHGARYLQNIDLVADVDLDRAAGLTGTTLHVDLLHNAGAFPNSAVGTLQCIDNIEVWDPKLRVFEAWVEKDLGGRASLRAGAIDLNSEFYATPSAGLLIAPPFGIGSELAATGPAGPSIFPLTSLGARVEKKFGETGYVRAAIFNARPGLHAGGPGSSLSFDKGVLSTVQAGVGGAQNISIGAWAYSRREDNLWLSMIGFPAATRRSKGAYMMVEQPLVSDGDRSMTAFARVGISDGKTSLFKGGWQGGVLATGLFKGRPAGQASIGIAQGALAGGFGNILRMDGIRPAKAESMIEATYSDRIAPFLTVQPDILYVVHPGGDARAKDAVILNVRFTFHFEHAR